MIIVIITITVNRECLIMKKENACEKGRPHLTVKDRVQSRIIFLFINNEPFVVERLLHLSWDKNKLLIPFD